MNRREENAQVALHDRAVDACHACAGRADVTELPAIRGKRPDPVLNRCEDACKLLLGSLQCSSPFFDTALEHIIGVRQATQHLVKCPGETAQLVITAHFRYGLRSPALTDPLGGKRQLAQRLCQKTCSPPRDDGDPYQQHGTNDHENYEQGGEHMQGKLLFSWVYLH